MATAVTDINVSLVVVIMVSAPLTIVVVEAAIADPAGAVAVTVAVATNPGGGGMRTKLARPAPREAADRVLPFSAASCRSFSIPRSTRLRAASGVTPICSATSANEKLR